MISVVDFVDFKNWNWFDYLAFVFSVITMTSILYLLIQTIVYLVNGKIRTGNIAYLATIGVLIIAFLLIAFLVPAPKPSSQ